MTLHNCEEPQATRQSRLTGALSLSDLWIASLTLAMTQWK